MKETIALYTVRVLMVSSILEIVLYLFGIHTRYHLQYFTNFASIIISAVIIYILTDEYLK